MNYMVFNDKYQPVVFQPITLTRFQAAIELSHLLLIAPRGIGQHSSPGIYLKAEWLFNNSVTTINMEKMQLFT